MRRHLLLTVSALAAMAACCSSPQTATGPGTGSETTNGIVATVVYPGGAPASGARVTLRPADYLAALPAPLGKSARTMFETVTDQTGRFAIDSLDPGDYAIEVNDRLSAASLIRLSASTAVVRRDSVADTLRPYGAVRVTVDTAASGGARRVALVCGLERSVPLDANGSVTLAALPAGTYQLRIVDQAGADSAITVGNVAAASAETTFVRQLPGWLHSTMVRINTSASGANVAENVTDFPLLVRLDSAAFGSAQAASLFFSQARDSGQDLRFAKADGSPLPYEIEQWVRAPEPQNCRAAVWVKVDTVYGNNASQHIMMYWGNASANSQSNSAAVFDTADGFSGVWHMGGTTVTDATQNRSNGSVTGTTQSPGMAGGSRHFTAASTDGINVGSSPALDVLNSDFTMSFWFRSEDDMTGASPDQRRAVLNKQINSTAGYSLFNAGGGQFYFEAMADGAWRMAGTGHTPQLRWTPHTWFYLAVTYRTTDKKLTWYVNGQQDAVLDYSFSSFANSTGQPLQIGRWRSGEHDEWTWGGDLDEVRIESCARSQAWGRLCHESQRTGQTVVTFR